MELTGINKVPTLSILISLNPIKELILNTIFSFQLKYIAIFQLKYFFFHSLIILYFFYFLLFFIDDRSHHIVFFIFILILILFLFLLLFYLDLLCHLVRYFEVSWLFFCEGFLVYDHEVC